MSYPLTTTLNRIWACNPCDEGKERALRAACKDAPDDEPITYQQIIKAVGLEDAMWCCRAEPQYSREWRLFAVWCARQVQHLMADERSINALDVAERHAHGEATDEELAAAWAAARAAAWDAARAAAWDTAWAAARAAAWDAARDAAWDTAWAAARDAARAAARAAAWDAARDAAWAAARAAAWDAARDAAWAAQRNAFIQLVITGELSARQETDTPNRPPLWQPIDTAPKDGTEILASDYDAIEIVRWKVYRNWESRWGEVMFPVWWQPLPDHPAFPDVEPRP